MLIVKNNDAIKVIAGEIINVMENHCIYVNGIRQAKSSGIEAIELPGLSVKVTPTTGYVLISNDIHIDQFTDALKNKVKIFDRIGRTRHIVRKQNIHTTVYMEEDHVKYDVTTYPDNVGRKYNWVVLHLREFDKYRHGYPIVLYDHQDIYALTDGQRIYDNLCKYSRSTIPLSDKMTKINMHCDDNTIAALLALHPIQATLYALLCPIYTLPGDANVVNDTCPICKLPLCGTIYLHSTELQIANLKSPYNLNGICALCAHMTAHYKPKYLIKYQHKKTLLDVIDAIDIDSETKNIARNIYKNVSVEMITDGYEYVLIGDDYIGVKDVLMYNTSTLYRFNRKPLYCRY